MTRVGLLAWGNDTGRLRDLAAALDGCAVVIGSRGLRRKWQVPIRYLLSIRPTIAWLTAHTPRNLIVVAPPLFPSLLAWAYSRRTGATLIIDAHPGSFGRRAGIWRALLPIQRALMRQAAATLVTEPGVAAEVESWGGKGLVLHEAPSATEPPAARQRDPLARKRVFFATTFGHDDPLDVMIGAAELLQDVDITFSGDFGRLGSARRQALQRLANVELTGWLSTTSYLERMRAANVVVALTTDVHSVGRSAFEAAWFERPTVLSDTPLNREYFSPSRFTRHTASALALAISSTLEDIDVDALAQRRKALEARWHAQRDALLACMQA